jgi:hypothetical protein
MCEAIGGSRRDMHGQEIDGPSGAKSVSSAMITVGGVATWFCPGSSIRKTLLVLMRLGRSRLV